MNKWNMKFKLAIACLLPLVATAALAGSIEITPVRLNLSDATKVGVLTVRNTGTDESVVQVTLNKWTLNASEYVYAQSQELVITPVTFRLAAGAQQLVRVGLRGSAPANKEAAYRLLVEEVPPPPAAGFTGAVLVVRHDLPVFVAPHDKATASLNIGVICAATGASLHVTNSGNVHSLLHNVVLKDLDSQKELAHWDTFDYLLPDAEKSWVLAQAAPAAAGKKLGVTMLTDQGSFAADVTKPCP